MISTIILFIFWYFSAIALLFTAIGANPKTTGFYLPDDVAINFKHLGEAMGGWSIWVIVSLIMILFPVNRMLDLAHTTKSYLQNDNSFFDKIIEKINKSLIVLSQRKKYSRITIIAHSLGSVFITEYLYKYPPSKSQKLRIITLGSPLILLASRSERIKISLNYFPINKITTWKDFYSSQDWLCSKIPINNNLQKIESTIINSKVPLDEKINGMSHELYFSDRAVIEYILDQAS